jgi:nucleoside-diphosphate-sugar epimerase
VERLGAEPVEGDITERDAWDRAARGVRAVVHAAALVAPRETYERFAAVNLHGTELAVAAARAAGAALVHISSVAVYGRIGQLPGVEGRIDEDAPLQPLIAQDFYARTKRAAEAVVRDGASDGFPAVALRPDVIYGERDRLFTPKVIRLLRLGVAPLVGSGRNHLACVYAGNVAGAVLAALDAPAAGFRAYNVTADAPPPLDQREFVAAFAAALGRRTVRAPVPVPLARLAMQAATVALRVWTPRAYAGLGRSAISFLTADNRYSSERARVELGWRPRFGTREAIARTVGWYRAAG